MTINRFPKKSKKYFCDKDFEMAIKVLEREFSAPKSHLRRRQVYKINMKELSSVLGVSRQYVWSMLRKKKLPITWFEAKKDA